VVAIPGGGSLAWSPDGGVIAVTSDRQSGVSFVDVRKGAVLGQCAFHNQVGRLRRVLPLLRLITRC